MQQDVLVPATILTAPGTIEIITDGASTVGIDLESLSGPTGFSYIIEGSVTGSDWFPVAAFDPSSPINFFRTAQTTVTGQWVVTCAGLHKVRFNLTAIATGDAIVTMHASSAVGPLLVAGGLIGLIPSFVKLQASAAGGATVTSVEIANNTTATVIKASPGQLYGIKTFNNGGSPAYVKLYDAITATAGAGTPIERLGMPSGSSAVNYNMGIQFGTGITAIVTTGIGDGDTTAPAASTFLVSFYWK